MSQLLQKVIQVASQNLAPGSRVRELARCLQGEHGFLGAFTRSDPLGDFTILLEKSASSEVNAKRLGEVLEEEIAPHHDRARRPGVPRQLVLDGSILGGCSVAVILLWDEVGLADHEGPLLLGGLLLSPEAELLQAADFYALLQVFQLALSRELFAERLEDYRAGLELVNALQPPVLDEEGGSLTRALTQFRRIIPFDAVALAFTGEAEGQQIRYLFPSEIAPRFVRDVKREMREALGILEDEHVEEFFENEAVGAGGLPLGERMESLLILPLLEGRGEDCGRIGFFSGSAGFFTDHHLRLLGLLAPTIGIGLGSLRSTEGLQNRAADLETAKAQVEAQLELARRLQTQLLSPSPPPPSVFRVSQRSDMSAAVGGDFYAARAFGKHRYAVAIADVSGKGLPAGLVMAHTLGALRAVWDVNPDPVSVMRRLNRSVLDATDDYSFVTAIVLLLDTRKQEVTFSCAGHEPAMRITPRGELQEFYTGDPPLGILPDHVYQEGKIPFEEGDRLFLFTDGVLDALQAGGERFGRERLMALLRGPEGSPLELQERVFTALGDFCQDLAPPDDITTLILDRRGIREPAGV
jgi:serine phosphatase RsbU (regulator of sigma subunit)